MSDDSQLILKTFQTYAETFEELKPRAVLPFYHYPAILISPEKAVAIKNQLEGWFTLMIVMRQLKQRGYDHACMPTLSVRQVGDNLAIVSGVVVRYTKDKELERFGLTYTLRKVDEHWKIIVGTLHDVIV